MVGYGRIKKKAPKKNDITFSPTKHSSGANILDIPKQEEIPPSLEVVADEHSNHKPVSKIMAFQSFEDLENLRPTKKQRMSNTTIFSLRTNSSSDRDFTSSQYSEDELSSQVSSTLEKINDRYDELQSEVNKHKNENNVLPKYSKSTPVISSQNEKFNHYGLTRSYQAEEKSLSANESEIENDSENEEVDPIDHRLDTKLVKAKKVESFSELKSSGKMAGAKLEFEMICEQLENWLEDDDKSDELLIVKLDLITKIRTNAEFRTYLEEKIVSKSKAKCYTLLGKLLKKSTRLLLANLQLINFFKLTTIDTSLYIEELAGITTFADHVQSANIHKRLLKDMADDWVKSCADIQPNTIISMFTDL